MNLPGRHHWGNDEIGEDAASKALKETNVYDNPKVKHPSRSPPRCVAVPFPLHKKGSSVVSSPLYTTVYLSPFDNGILSCACFFP
jgi:hypothetical protein